MSENITAVHTYNGGEHPMDECSQFTIGNHSGEWYHNQDEDVLELQSGEFCHKIDDEDEIHETVCGDLFHDDEM